METVGSPDKNDMKAEAACCVVTCLRKGIYKLSLTVSFQPLDVAMSIEAHYVEFFSSYLSPAMHSSKTFFTMFQKALP